MWAQATKIGSFDEYKVGLNGRPWRWSWWKWDSKIIVGIASLILTLEKPLPQSSMIWALSVRISTQGVEPPYFAVKGPEVGIDPLTPWLIIIKFPHIYKRINNKKKQGIIIYLVKLCRLKSYYYIY